MSKKNGTTNEAAMSLFQSYQAKDDAVQAARVALEQAMLDRGHAVAKITTELGSGPFEWQDKVVKATKRDTKDEEGNVTSTTFFFKSIGASVQKIG